MSALQPAVVWIPVPLKEKSTDETQYKSKHPEFEQARKTEYPIFQKKWACHLFLYLHLSGHVKGRGVLLLKAHFTMNITMYIIYSAKTCIRA